MLNMLFTEWQAHDNAVFDIAWVPGANSLVSFALFFCLDMSSLFEEILSVVLNVNIHLQVTASGDQTARFWDVITGDLLGTFKGHQCSLKSVAFSKQEKGSFTDYNCS